MRELEIKFALPPALQASLEAAPDWPLPVRSRIWSRYLDTPDGKLASARMAVRVRRDGDLFVQTVKTDRGTGFERFEWERPIAGPEPELAALPPADSHEGALARRTFADWQPLFETDFERTAWTLLPQDEGLIVEVALDRGEIRSGSECLPIREVELEAKAGTPAAFFRWALEWAGRNDATLLMPSKNERGLRLVNRLPRVPPAVKAGTRSPGTEATVGEAAARIIAGCVAHFCANLEPVAVDVSAEGPHQLRVALRRLRAALRFFELKTLDDRWRALDAQAAGLADAAASVRDADVFEQGVLAALEALMPGDAAFHALAQALQAHRDDARHRLRELLGTPATTGFVLRALQLGEQLASASGPTDGRLEAYPIRPDRFAAPFAPYAAERLRSLHARLHRRSRRARDDADWHRARIAAKDLRYAMSFGAGALPRQVPVKATLAALEKLQRRLGAAQDAATAPSVAAAALARPAVAADHAIRALAWVDAWRALAAPAPRGRRRCARRALRRIGDALSRLEAAGVVT